jgi:hypothetical protein
MKLPWRRLSRHPRGQGLVEMAIILPLLALMLVMAIDFGRVFFGWVALNNAARIGADTAASFPDVWNGTFDGDQEGEFARYRGRVSADLQALGCQDDPVPDPIFDTDVDGDGDFYSDGDLARLELECAFPLLTPLAELAVGGPVTLHATSQFAITRTINGGIEPPPDACPAGQAEIPSMVGQRMQDAYDDWIAAGFQGVRFSPQVTNSNKNKTVLDQNPGPGCADPGTASMLVNY